MGYQLPKYVIDASLNNQLIDYFWDDTDIDQKLDYNYASPYIKRMRFCTLRAKIILSIGVYEWMLGRFHLLHDEDIFYQLSEAALCANVDKRYLQYTELDYRKYRGPIKYALWLAYAALYPVLLVSENISDPNNKDDCIDPLFMYDKNIWEGCLSTLMALLKYTLPKEKLKLFEDWLDLVISRLNSFYIELKENAFMNLFGHSNDKEWLGDYIAREVLDPKYLYNPTQSVKLLNQFLSQVNRVNTFLLPFNELKEKIKYPYHIEN